ncbi:hypothetical protein E2C01_097995 [Portunus trituberculatus]|uniref:Uncharacterized protein n=1 Tax=Portunus trituberculatus TaxID=210409 RepID=A0A5B7K6C8_PORTR|nr:hypothetical protein [Portunus trituberculatus]
MERLPVFVSALEDLCLLGIDFLTRVGASLDFQEGKFKGTWPGSSFDRRR